MSHSSHLKIVRALELERICDHLPAPGASSGTVRLLELGAGTGQQANVLSGRGYEVVAFDLPTSHYFQERVFPVADYDGSHLPCADQSVDAVFSSHVLEHVVQLDTVLAELRRVMVDDGVAVHVIPSSACRLWSIPAHYVWLARRLLAVVARPAQTGPASLPDDGAPRAPGSMQQWLATLFPMRHGERGSTLSEPYYYSRFWWRKQFERNGYEVVRIDEGGLFYTMTNSLTHRVPLAMRARLARIMGSACNIFVLRKTEAAK